MDLASLDAALERMGWERDVPRIVAAARLAGGARGLLASLSREQAKLLQYDWRWWARPLRQTGPREFLGQEEPPGDWTHWLIMTGAGWGKTLVGGKWVTDRAWRFPRCRIAVVGGTAKDAREVMAFGESGIVEKAPPWFRPHFDVTNQCLEFPNGSMAFLYSAEVPDALRGPQHHFAWCDEPAKWRRLQEAYDLMFHRLRLGAHPQVVLTTTPKRLPLLHKLVKDPTTAVTRGRTTDNAANLPESWLRTTLANYAGTTLGRQELEGVLFEDVPGALWQAAWLDGPRLSPPQGVAGPSATLEWLATRLGAPLKRIVVAVDPATTSKEDSDECGIVVAGLGRSPNPGDDREHVYVLADATQRASPDRWAREVVRLVRAWGAALVVAETTMGGETIPALIRFVDDAVKVVEKGGNRGKITRAEPVAAVYEQGRVHHVGMFTQLEEQQQSYTLDTRKSPNNLDACVHAVGELILRERGGFSLA
jgi:phage terminase large subunit-like protein